MHVAAEQQDRRGRLGAFGSARDRPQPVAQLLERAIEGSPVLEVDCAPEPLAQVRRELSPAARTERLVPRLEVMDADGQEHR